MPQLTKFYGILPADVDAMTVREISEYRSQMQAYLAEEANPHGR